MKGYNHYLKWGIHLYNLKLKLFERPNKNYIISSSLNEPWKYGKMHVFYYQYGIECYRSLSFS